MAGVDPRGYLFGIDVGGTATKVGLFTIDGTMVSRSVFESVSGEGAAQVAENLGDHLDAVLAKIGIEPEDIIGVGLGMPAMIDPDGTIRSIVNIDLDVDAIKEQLAEMFPHASSVLVNDANGAAFGECWQGCARGKRDVVFITIGTGVGAGIISGGRIVQGATGVAGEIGHIEFVPNGLPCNCGRRGCLEKYVSATAIAEAAQRALDEGAESKLSEVAGTRSSGPGTATKLDAKAVFEAAAAGDALACSVVDTFAEQLGRALAMVACVVNPEVFVIGGGASLSGDIWIEKAQVSFRRHALPACADTPIVAARLGNDAGMYGDASLALEAYGMQHAGQAAGAQRAGQAAGTQRAGQAAGTHAGQQQEGGASRRSRISEASRRSRGRHRP